MYKNMVLVVVLVGCIGTLGAQSYKFSIGEWGPYTGAKLEGGGLATRVISAALGKLGVIPEFEYVPWKRAEQNVLIGTSFATFPYVALEERKSTYLFSTPFANSRLAVTILSGNPKTKNFSFESYEHFKGYSVGITVGSDEIKIPLVKAGVKVEEVPTPEQGLRMLLAKRFDFFIDEIAVLNHSMKTGFDETESRAFMILEKPFGRPVSYSLMVSRKYPDAQAMLAKFENGLKVLRESGELAKILSEYGVK